MVFSSAVFLFAFLPAVFLVYRLLPRLSHVKSALAGARGPSGDRSGALAAGGLKWQNAWLALASIVFYAFGQIGYVPLFLLSVAVNYTAGLLLKEGAKHRRTVLTGALVLNLGVLGLYKYTDFLLSNLNALLGLQIPLPGIELPVGISFFTFQGLSYVIDVYRDPRERSGSFFKVLLYISFFPQLIAGPIVRYHDISAQIDSRRASGEDVAEGVSRFIMGLAKKLLLANTAGLAADRIFNEVLPAGLLDWRLAWLGALSYTLQIYFDFSGYSDMAIGMGHLFGFTIKENFHYPYSALSLRDFWRRWHISLSGWFREYLYIPLGGNRRGRGRTLLNRMIVFLCTGIWHGANWTFILWGLLHGALTCLEDAGVLPVGRLSRSALGRALSRVYTLLSVTLLFVLFRAKTVSEAWQVIAAMFSAPATAGGTWLLHSICPPATALLLCLGAALSFGPWPRLRARFEALAPERQAPLLVLGRAACLGLLVLCLLNLSSGGFNPFIYFQF